MIVSFNTHSFIEYTALLSPLTDEEIEGQRNVKQRVTQILGDETGFKSRVCISNY